ncbi:menaquinone biosynthetic enzyme MqnA/MqnD family protein [Paenibacillus thermotolerans]|uniref:menaquinone biosynthetic enzyme MqnA/MqnD family protein n=1 Tax=Paenibacillus thermotolerans TaxID=3027807 RepID=UPI0023678C68|nr:MULTISPECIES: menaquinone biosynthesis protein [unclassified Paenibacillus]
MLPKLTQTKAGTETESIRMGKIVYTNVWPVFYGFPQHQMEDKVELITGTPAELNGMLASGEIDAAAVSSFAYAKHSDKLLLLPDLSVSSRGAVGSLLLFSKKPLHEYMPERIALTNASATSVHLLKVIMAKRYRHNPEYVAMPPDLDSMLESCDAALLIGDDAIKASWREHGLFVSDLGQMWKDWTGHGMTYAVWAVREQWVKRHPEQAALLHQALISSKRDGLRLPAALLDTAVERIGGDSAYWRRYFSNLVYEFGEEQAKGLSLFFSYAYELGLLPDIPSLRVWRHPNVMRVNE